MNKKQASNKSTTKTTTTALVPCCTRIHATSFVGVSFTKGRSTAGRQQHHGEAVVKFKERKILFCVPNTAQQTLLVISGREIFSVYLDIFWHLHHKIKKHIGKNRKCCSTNGSKVLVRSSARRLFTITQQTDISILRE